MTTYYDALNSFFKSLGSERLASSAQLIYVHLLHLNNRSGNRGVVQVTDRELNELTQLSRPTVTKAKQILKNRGLIDFKTDNRNPHAGTVYTLQFFSQSLSQSLSQSVSQSVSQTPDVANIHVREDFKDLKTLDSIPSVHSAGACENFSGEQQLIDLWLANNGAAVSFELLSYLKMLVDQHGLDFTESAIRETATSYGGDFRISLKYFRSCVERKLKGGDRNALRLDGQSRGNRPGVFKTPDRGTASDSGNTPPSRKGRFDDDEPDYSWLYEEIKRIDEEHNKANQGEDGTTTDTGSGGTF